MNNMKLADKRRVVVTGLGVVSSIGIGLDNFKAALINGVDGSSEIDSFDSSKFPSHLGCEVKNFNAGLWLRKMAVDSLGRSSQMAIAATYQALNDSGMDEKKLQNNRCDVVMGTTDGEAAVFDQFSLQFLQEGEASLNTCPSLVTAEAISDSIQEEFELMGDSMVLATACSAGNYAISYAFDKIQTGGVDMVICGGSDSQCLKNFGGFNRIGALAPEKCQPFDLNRKGILPGEGAGVLLLESLETALERGANIYAEVLGYGASCDGHHVMQPHVEGIVNCNNDALKRCNVSPDEIDYICAHGTATSINDVVETSAMKLVFGDKLPPMSAIKSMLGHTMGAASALSSIACCLAIKHDFIPPTLHFENPDPECEIDCVANHSREVVLNIVQNNAFAFGGNNSIILFQKNGNLV